MISCQNVCVAVTSLYTHVGTYNIWHIRIGLTRFIQPRGEEINYLDVCLTGTYRYIVYAHKIQHFTLFVDAKTICSAER